MARRKVGAEAARNNLPKILEDAHRGSPTIVTKRGKPYAAVVPIDQARKGPSRLRLLSLKGTGRGLWGKDSTSFIKKMRDEW